MISLIREQIFFRKGISNHFGWNLLIVKKLVLTKILLVPSHPSPDNMPVTWCYKVEGGNVFCATGFPVGCYVDAGKRPKDACVIDVSWISCLLPFSSCVFVILLLSC